MRFLVALILAVFVSLPASAQGVEKWEIFPAGAVPKGVSVTDAEAATLADGVPKERTYLVGQFIVAAAAAKRAVFRSALGSVVRVVVEYPADLDAPPENAVVARDDARPLLITNIRHANDGHVTVYVREIVKP